MVQHIANNNFCLFIPDLHKQLTLPLFSVIASFLLYHNSAMLISLCLSPRGSKTVDLSNLGGTLRDEVNFLILP